MNLALITGSTGLDGSYLAEAVLGKGYLVHGLIRRASTFNPARIDHLYQDPHDSDVRLFVHDSDLIDGHCSPRCLSRSNRPRSTTSPRSRTSVSRSAIPSTPGTRPGSA
jgi:GDP-D-mannose dehydratase